MIPIRRITSMWPTRIERPEGEGIEKWCSKEQRELLCEIRKFLENPSILNADPKGLIHDPFTKEEFRQNLYILRWWYSLDDSYRCEFTGFDERVHTTLNLFRSMNAMRHDAQTHSRFSMEELWGIEYPQSFMEFMQHHPIRQLGRERIAVRTVKYRIDSYLIVYLRRPSGGYKRIT